MSRPKIGDLIPIGGREYNFLGNVENLKVSGVGDGYVKIRWSDPDPSGWAGDTSIPDWIIDGIEIAEWAGTQIRMKTGGYPAHELDGTLIIDSTVHDAYAETDLLIENLTNDTDYYIMAFPYTERHKFRIDAANRVKATPRISDDPYFTPGPIMLLAGDMTEGFFGEVSQGDFITFAALTTACGITQGTAYNDTESWLKFAKENTILFSPRKPIRHSISWSDINSKKCVYGGSSDTVIKIGDHYFKVRLFRGLKPSNNPKVLSSAYNGAVCHESEWNRLMCRIHEEAYTGNWYAPNNIETGLTPLYHELGSGSQKLYTDADLLTKGSYGNGSYQWCQEIVNVSGQRSLRGYGGVSGSIDYTSSATVTHIGWRPVLELIPPE